MSGVKRSRNDYELSKKIEIIYSIANPKLSQKDIREHFEKLWKLKIG